MLVNYVSEQGVVIDYKQNYISYYMNTKMQYDALVTCIKMVLPSFYADIFSASAQMTIKSVLPILLISVGITTYSFD